MAEDLVMKPFSLTYVEYEDGNAFSLVFALLSLAPITLVVIQATIACCSKELSFIYLFAGQLFNEVINLLLKNVFKHKRPEGAKRTDHGMPSAHTQFMFFFATFFLLFFLTKVKFRSFIWKPLYVMSILALTGLVAYGRLVMSMHTLDQVLVGAVFGTLIGTFWFLFYVLLNHYHVFSYIEELSLAKYFYIRDSFNLLGDPREFDYSSYWKYREDKFKQTAISSKKNS